MNESEKALDWNSKTERDGQALLRIAALLFGFAVLAERVAGQPAPVRLMLLAILRSAESVAREFITGQTGAGPATYPPGRFSDDTAEATRLAQSCRALASALDLLCSILACTARRPADGGIGHDMGRIGHGLLSVLGSPHRRAGFAGLCPDTS